MDVVEIISQSQSRKSLNEHSLIRRMRKEAFSMEQVALILGQWFHPLHYFPSFVSRMIGISPSLEVKAVMSKIVWQELGEGDVQQAHERIFTDTMTTVGFKLDDLIAAAPLPATAKLVAEYERKSANDYLSSLGYVYATESADLAMVGSIGVAVRKATGVRSLPWVDIHVKQEPDHTDCVDTAVASDLNEADAKLVLEAADVMFGLWCDFFSHIEAAVDRIKEMEVV